MARRYVRDNKGRFASVGATARGGRLRTAAGNKRKAQTMKIEGKKPAGTIGKNRSAKPAAKPAALRPDTAAANISMRGSRGRSLDRDISRNVKQQKVAARSADRARNSKFKTDQSRAKKLREVHVPAIAKAKGLSKGQVESALKAQTPSTQIKALKNWVKQNRTAKPAAPSKPAARRKPVGKIDEAKASRIVSRIDANRPGQRRASESTRRDMNSLRTHERATQFVLAPSARMRKRGTPISVDESVKRAVANASKQNRTAKPTAKPVVTKVAGNNAARAGVKSFKRSGKAQKMPGRSPSGTISQSKDTRNRLAREAAFKRRVNRASDNMRGAGKTYNTYAAAHKYGNAPGQGVKIERSYKQALRREATAKKALAVYQGTARPTANDSRVYGRPYGMSRPAVSRTSKGYKPAAERLPAPSKAAQRAGRAANNKLRAGDRRHYTGRNRAATAGSSARALKFYKAPKSYLKVARDKKNRKLTEGAGFRLPRSLRR